MGTMTLVVLAAQLLAFSPTLVAGNTGCNQTGDGLDCSMCTGYMAGKCGAFKGLLGKIASLEDDPLWEPRINEWEKCTGADIQMTFIDEDDMQGEMERDVGTTYYKGDGAGSLIETSGAGIYDVYHIQPTFLPKTLPNIENLSPWIRQYDQSVKWSDVNPLSRKAVFFNSTVRALPLDTDYIAFGYREDLLQKYGKEKPETLEEMVELAEFMQGKDLDGDGEDGDFGMCTNYNTWTLYSLFLPMMITGTDFGRCIPPSSCLTIEENIFFNATDMEPFFNTTAFRKALTLLRRLIIASNVWSDEKYGCRTGNGWNCDRKKAFMTGRCAMFFSLPGTTTRMINGRNRPQHCKNCTNPKSCDLKFLEAQYKKGCQDDLDNPTVWYPNNSGEIWYTRRSYVPGVTEVWDAKTNTMKECTPELCPRAVTHSRTGKLVNAGTYFPEGGESYALRAGASPEIKTMMFEFLTRMSTLHLAETPLGGNYRKSQSTQEYIDSFVNEYGWNAQVVNDLYKHTLGFIFSDNWNTAQDLLMLGHDDYMGAIKKHVYKDYFGLGGGTGPLVNGALSAEAQAALDEQLIANLTAAWRRITSEWGMLLQNERWRIALSLPQLSKEKRCELYTKDMNLRETNACMKMCPPGSFFDFTTGECGVCPARRYNRFERKIDKCDPCPAGSFCVEGSINPKGCPPGKYSDELAVKCEDCQEGKHAQQMGMSRCENCSLGMFQPNTGEQFCQACEIGTYQDDFGTTFCKVCKSTMTTAKGTSQNNSDCRCGAGTYYVAATGYCKACGEAEKTGISCPIFDGKPLVAPGFYMPPNSQLNVEKLNVYRCMSAENCPGQKSVEDPVCGKDSHRNQDKINCGLCEEDYFDEDGQCVTCGDASGSLMFPLSCILAWLFCGLIHYLWNNKGTAQVEAAEGVLASVTFGLTLGFIQALGIFNRLRFSWPIEFQDLLNVFSLFLVDIDLLRPGCVMPKGLATSYITKLLVPIFFCVVFLTWRPASLILNKVTKGKFMVFHWDGILNSLGMVIQALYISFAASTLSLVECYGSPNGQTTIRGYPYAECDSSEFYYMIPVFIIAVIVYIIGIFSIFCYGAFIAPKRYVEDMFRVRIRFLVFKFRPNKYWYGVILMIRSFLLAMVGVLFPDDVFHQFIGMNAILVTGLFVHLVLSPYADRFANNLESAELCVLLAIMSIGSWFMTDRDFESNEAHTYSIILVLLTSYVFICVFVVFCWAMYLAQFPKKALDMHEKEVDDVLPRLKNICNIISGSEDYQIKDVIQNASYIDRWHVYSMASFFALELCGLQTTSMSHWRLPKVSKEVRLERKNSLEEESSKVELKRSASTLSKQVTPDPADAKVEDNFEHI